MSTAIVSGALANKLGNGGNAWTRLTLLLGLRRLGFDVFFVEQIDEPTPRQRAFVEDVLAPFSIPWALVSARAEPPEPAAAAAEAADVLINIGGHLTLEVLKRPARHRVFLDDDPGYTQFWHAAGQLGDRLLGHDAYVTYGANIGRPDCPIPTGGIGWRPARPPVLTDRWLQPTGTFDRFTTVASWRGAYGRVQREGTTYGVKAHEFRKLVDLPRLVDERFEVALDIAEGDEADRALLAQAGWQLLDPGAAAGTPDAFHDYVSGSGAEFSPAQGIYVETNSGWFSDRTTCYLAAGRPVLVQDTGFSRNLPVGEGLLVFTTVDDAVKQARRLRSQYATQCAAARCIAAEFFDSDRVLSDLVER